MVWPALPFLMALTGRRGFFEVKGGDDFGSGDEEEMSELVADGFFDVDEMKLKLPPFLSRRILPALLAAYGPRSDQVLQ